MASLMKLCNGFQSRLTLYARISSTVQNFLPAQRDNDEKTRKPGSAFSLFLKEKYGTVTGHAPAVRMRVLGEMWRNAPAHEQEYYENLRQNLLEEYKSSVKTPPRRPASGFAIFFKENYEVVRSQYTNQQDTMRKIGELWRELPEYERKEYNRRSSQLIQEYKDNLTEEDKSLIEEVKTARQKRMMRRYKGGSKTWESRPKIPPANPYIQFKREMKSNEDQHMSSEQLRQEWNTLTEQEKSEYKERAIQYTEQIRDQVNLWEKENRK